MATFTPFKDLMTTWLQEDPSHPGLKKNNLLQQLQQGNIEYLRTDGGNYDHRAVPELAEKNIIKVNQEDFDKWLKGETSTPAVKTKAPAVSAATPRSEARHTALSGSLVALAAACLVLGIIAVGYYASIYDGYSSAEKALKLQFQTFSMVAAISSAAFWIFASAVVKYLHHIAHKA